METEKPRQKKKLGPKIVLGFIALTGVVAVEEYLRQMPLVSYERILKHPPSRAGEVSLLVTGDVGSGNENQIAVAELLERLCLENSPDAIVLLGDNFYERGVKTTEDPQWFSKFENMYNKACLASKKFYIVLGNHDYKGNVTAQIEYTKRGSGRWTLPSRYYEAQFDNILGLFAIDTNIPEKCGIASLCSMDWMAKQIQDSTAQWKVIIGHHPVLSLGKHRKLDFLPSLTLPHLICSTKADLYLAGHDHNMQHLKGSYRSSACDIDQFVLGSGGATSYPIEKREGLTKFAASNYGAGLLKFNKTTAQIILYNTEKKEPLYSYSLQKNGTENDLPALH
jgi:tartrate-resistant acid phosphatase type 5